MNVSQKVALFAAAGLAPLLTPTLVFAYSPAGSLLTSVAPAAWMQAADESQPARRPSEVRREYDLNPEKAQAVFELLAPGDIKVLVGQREGGVFIKGTPREAKVFDAFVEILTRHAHRNVTDTHAFIDELRPTWDSEKVYKLPPPKAHALYRVLAFHDVPVLVSRAPDGIGVEGSKADQRVIADVVRVLKGQRLEDKEKSKSEAKRATPDRPRRAKRPAHPAPPAAEHQGRFEEMIDRLDARRKELEKSVEELTERARQIAQAVDQLGAQIEQEAHRFAEELKQRVAPPPPASGSPKHGGETIVREYRLPGVHAQNLFNLLAPSDIRDVVVSRRDNIVEIRADAYDHETIARLVDILTRGAEGSAAR